MRASKASWWAIPILVLFAVPAFSQAPDGPGSSDQQNNTGVARVSFIHGDVSMQRGDSGDFSSITLNTPLVAGDKVATGAASRTELQLDYANILRLDQNAQASIATLRSEEHTSELQSHVNLVCRLLLEKKKKKNRQQLLSSLL